MDDLLKKILLPETPAQPPSDDDLRAITHRAAQAERRATRRRFAAIGTCAAAVAACIALVVLPLQPDLEKTQPSPTSGRSVGANNHLPQPRIKTHTAQTPMLAAQTSTPAAQTPAHMAQTSTPATSGRSVGANNHLPQPRIETYEPQEQLQSPNPALQTDPDEILRHALLIAQEDLQRTEEEYQRAERAVDSILLERHAQIWKQYTAI